MRFFFLLFSFLFFNTVVSAQPYINYINPNYAMQGDSLGVTISGNNINYGGQWSGTLSSFRFSQWSGTNMFYGNSWGYSGNNLLGIVYVPSWQPVGWYDLQVFNQNTGSWVTDNNAFYVDYFISNSSINYINPDSAEQGQVLSVTISGNNINYGSQWSGTLSSFRFSQWSGTNMFYGNSTSANGNYLYGTVAVPSSQPVGWYDLEVFNQNNNSWEILTNGFKINYPAILIPGCVDTVACNFDPSANMDDGSCSYIDDPSVDFFQSSNVFYLDIFGDFQCNGGFDFLIGAFSFFNDGVWYDWNGAVMGTWSVCDSLLTFSWGNGHAAGVIGSDTIIFSSPQGYCYTAVLPFVPGCTDSAATNYDPNANTDDGSCLYCDLSTTVTVMNASGPGACDGFAFASTFTSNSPVDYYWLDGTGDTIQTGVNFVYNLCYGSLYSLYTIDAIGCSDTNIFVVDSSGGCTDPLACNYDSLANIDDGSCIFISNPVVDILQGDSIGYWNIDWDFDCDGIIDGYYGDHTYYSDNTWAYMGLISGSWSMCDSVFSMSCFGCTPELIVNGVYDNDTIISSTVFGCATIYPYVLLLGCTDATACNYDPAATNDDGSCILPDGCTDPIAYNYDSLATCDDGSCQYCDLNIIAFMVQQNSTASSCDGWAFMDASSSNNSITYDWLDDNGVSLSSQNNVVGLCTGTYALIVTDGFGCVIDTSFTIGSAPIYGCTDPAADNYDPNATIDDGSCTYPSACNKPTPTGQHVTEIIHNRVRVHWDNMTDAICLPKQYRIQYRVQGTSAWSQKNAQDAGLCNFGLSTTSKRLTNLTPGTTYEYRIKAWYCNTTGASIWSSIDTFTTAPVCPNVGNFAVSTPLTTRAVFTWDDSNGPYSFVRIKFRIDSIQNPTGSDWQSAGGFGVFYPTFTRNKNGLTPGETYRGQSRTWCDPSGGMYKSLSWTPLIFWTQPTVVREGGGQSITNLDIYPNPSRDIFNISFTSEEKQDLQLRVLNVVGEEILLDDMQQFVGEYVRSIDLNKHSKGIYLLEVITDKGIINKKLILQ